MERGRFLALLRCDRKSLESLNIIIIALEYRSTLSSTYINKKIIVTSPPAKKTAKANLTIRKCQQRKEFYLLQTKCRLIWK